MSRLDRKLRLLEYARVTCDRLITHIETLDQIGDLFMRTGLAAFVFATLLVPGSTAQDQSTKIFDAPDISRILNKSSDPNPFAELTKGAGFRVTIRRRTQLDVAIRHERRVEVYHILD